MLCAMRAIYGTLAAALGVLVVTGLLSPAWVLAIAALAGVVRPNDLVMRNTLIGETIPPVHLMGAVGMSRATSDSARVGGALAGAGLSTALGLGATYLIVTLFYAASLALTFRIARRPTAPDPGGPPRRTVLPGASRWVDLKDGLLRVARAPELLAMTLLAFLINLTAYPASSGLLPYAAKHVYHVEATGLGLLVASFALGGLLASIFTVLTGGPRHAERSTLVGTVVWYALVLAFGHAGRMELGLLALFLAGFAQNIAMIAMTAGLIAAAGEGFRSRVMGVRMLAVYGLPLGLLASSALIERIGYPATLSLSAALGLLFTVLIAVRWRTSLWQRHRRAAEIPQRA
jgi:MFS family permease